MGTAVRSDLALPLVLVLLGACGPTCGQVCRKALDCGIETDRMSRVECEQDCQRQEDLYDRWGDEEKQQALRDHHACVMGASCEELADEVCYDPLIFIF